MYVLPILHMCAQHCFRVFVHGISLTRTNAYVCSCANVYPIITKLIAVFRSRQGHVAFELEYNFGDCHNKSNRNIK